MGRIAGTEHFRNIERHGAQTLPGVVFLRVDESLFFGNLRAVEERLSLELNGHAGAQTQHGQPVHDLVLVMSAVNRVDMTALEALTELEEGLRKRNIRLHLAEVKGPVQDRMAHTPLWKSLAGRVHFSSNDAFEALRP
jgi:SulP family sulfate permease